MSTVNLSSDCSLMNPQCPAQVLKEIILNLPVDMFEWASEPHLMHSFLCCMCTCSIILCSLINNLKEIPRMCDCSLEENSVH